MSTTTTSFAYAPALADVFGKLPTVEFSQYSWLVKADVSGIQAFIFYVQSSQAARTLKGRSFYIHALGLLVEEALRADPATGQCFTLYNGGGNVYLLCEGQPNMQALRASVDTALQYEQLYLTLALTPLGNAGFGAARADVEQAAQAGKMRAFETQATAFDAFERSLEPPPPWRDLTRELVRATHYSLRAETGADKIHRNYVHALGHKLSLQQGKGGDNLSNSVLQALPKWTPGLIKDYPGIVERIEREETDDPATPYSVESGNILEFGALAYLAEERTGTARLGVLKMDIDNLGRIFEQVADFEEVRRLSVAFSWFFDQRFHHLWRHHTFSYTGESGDTFEASYSDNLYVVFAGGDDCFVVGGWDAVFQFTLLVRTEFLAFVEALRLQVPSLTQAVTLSAGLVVVNRKYPALRFAKEAEEALEIAKTYDEAKNRITLFGEALRWDDFDQAAKFSAQLAGMIHSGVVKRAIIERIKRSAWGYEKLQARAKAGELQTPKVWRLFYYLGKRERSRDSQREKQQQELDFLIRTYAEGLIDAFVQGTGTSHMVFPIAARWAEFLTAKPSEHHAKRNL